MVVRYRVAASVAFTVLMALAAAPDASAQQPKEQKAGQDLAVAESLFREGKAAMREKRFDEACSKFAESNRLDPQTGTLLNLAACHEAGGKTASAWGEFNEVIAQAMRAGQTSRVDFARQHAAAVESKLSRVKLVSTESSSSVTVKVDGKVVGAGGIGTAIPMDPGSHRIEVSASGKRSRDVTFDVPQGPSTTEVRIPVLDGAVATGAVPSDKLEDPPPATKPPSRSSSGGGKRTAGFILGGVGIAGLAVGAVFGVMYLGKKDDYNKCDGFCGGTAQSDEDQKSTAQTTGWISTAGFGVGLVGLAAGTILILSSKSSSPERPEKSATVRVVPALSFQSGGLSLQGKF